MGQWQVALMIPLIALVIPLAILISVLWQKRALIFVAVAAFAALLALGIIGATGTLADAILTPSSLADIWDIWILIGLAIVGCLLMFAGWALALADAAQERNRLWFGVLTLGVYLTMALFIQVAFSANFYCLSVNAQLPNGSLMCAEPAAQLDALYLVACLVGPGVILAYALTARRGLKIFIQPRGRLLPEGLSAAPLDAPQLDEGL